MHSLFPFQRGIEFTLRRIICVVSNFIMTKYLENNLDSFRNVTIALNPEVFEETSTNNWVAVLKCMRKLFKHSFH